MRRIFAFLGRHAWIFVVLAFMLVAGAWSVFYIIASKVPRHRLQAAPPAPHASP